MNINHKNNLNIYTNPLYINMETIFNNINNNENELFDKSDKIIVTDDSIIYTIRKIIRKNPHANLNHIDTSRVTKMDYLFYNGVFDSIKFDGDISGWDVSNVTDMSHMFEGSDFNGDISKWDVSNVINMSYMFDSSKFNGDISKWDVSNVTDMSYMFANSKFNQDISRWDVSGVINDYSNLECIYKAETIFRESRIIGKYKPISLQKYSIQEYKELFKQHNK